MAAIPNDQRLDGWKAIANFLGRERTTAIRWTNERGLPVHRVPGGRTGTVYAIKSELEAWLASDRNSAESQVSPAAKREELAPTTTRAVRQRMLLAASVAVAISVALVVIISLQPSLSANAPISLAAVASPGASRDTREFARALNADLERFTNASPTLAVFEREPGAAPGTDYAVRTEIERKGGKMVADARLISVRQGQVIWSRHFEQSGPGLSALREQVAAKIVGALRCSFGGLENERPKAQPADIEQLMAICQSFEENDSVAAEARARQLTLAHPDLGFAWAMLALIEGDMVGQGHNGSQAQALANSRRAELIAPGNSITWLAQAAASGEGPTSPRALPILDDALRMHPNQPWLLGVRSVVLFNLGYVQESVVDSLRSLSNDPSSFGSHDIAVRRLAAAGLIRDAVQLQSENERIWPGHPQVIANRAHIFWHDANHREADIKSIGEFERKYSSTPYAAYTLARLYERIGNRQAALAWLARAPVRNTLQQSSQLFWPDAAGLRGEPVFFRKMADIGLVRWWLARGKWPDFCAESGLKYDCAEEARKLH